MNQKVSAVLDEELLRRAEKESMRQNKPLSSLLGVALKFYLDEVGEAANTVGVVARSWGALSLAPETLQSLLENEDDFLDA
jgi:hypothetical protein